MIKYISSKSSNYIKIKYTCFVPFKYCVGNKHFSVTTCTNVSENNSTTSEEESSEESSNASLNSEELVTSDLAREFRGNPSGLIQHFDNKLDLAKQKSNAFMSEYLEDRQDERKTIEATELEKFDAETQKSLEDEKDVFEGKIRYYSQIRDDALDTIHGLHANSPGSDFESDYDSDTSQARIDAEYNTLDSNYSAIKDEQYAMIDQFKQKYNEICKNLDSLTNPSDTVAESSKGKRKLDDSDLNEPNLEGSSTKRSKLDRSELSEDLSNNKDESKKKESPIDYVLEKQQMETFDFTDDLD